MKSRSLFAVAALASMLAATLSPLTAFSASLHPVNRPTPTSNQFWWPNQLDLSPLRSHSAASNPYGENFDYAKAFNTLDLDALKKDINTLLTTEQDWWPADYGNYGPFFIRMAWHSAGTYRTLDGRGGAGGGQQRFEPLNSWPDNANLDKARRLLWPIKQKYGRKVSWADLMVLTGNVALENMGFETIGFAGGREDDWEPDLVYWGSETEFLANNKRYHHGKLDKPLAAVQMGLIYVNPEGPNGNGKPLAAAQDMRESFGRMAMNDEEIVALTAGGHTFGKAHGAHKPDDCVGAEPAAAALEAQGFGWKNDCGKGHSEDTVTSGLEGAWTSQPAKWTHEYLTNLFAFEWVEAQSPAGATLWIPKDGAAANTVPDAHIKGKFHAPMMFTTDLALKRDPEFRKISKHFLEKPKAFEHAFAKAWFKLTHRDMGPNWRYLGKDIPSEQFIWQDPLPERDYELVTPKDISELKHRILTADLPIPALVRTAWASAASFRGTDMRGGANGGRIQLAPQNTWAINTPDELNRVITTLADIQADFNKGLDGNKHISMADTIVLAGAAAIEKASGVDVPFTPGRVDASQSQTDISSFNNLELKNDGFRNYYAKDSLRSPVNALVERASLLNLTVPEMTVLVGGLRSLNANANGSAHGVLTDKPGTLSQDFFINLLDMATQWEKSTTTDGIYEGRNRQTGKLTWTATPVDLVFGSNSELRAVAEVYASDDAKDKFNHDFVQAWTKVMNLDRPTH